MSDKVTEALEEKERTVRRIEVHPATRPPARSNGTRIARAGVCSSVTPALGWRPCLG